MSDTKSDMKSLALMFVFVLGVFGGFKLYSDLTPATKQASAQTSTQESPADKERRRSEEHAASMKKWYAENPDFLKKPEPEEDRDTRSGNYLDSRSGPALERTVRRIIDMAGYECGSVRGTRQETGRVLVDCGADGVYLIVESGGKYLVKKG